MSEYCLLGPADFGDVNSIQRVLGKELCILYCNLDLSGLDFLLA